MGQILSYGLEQKFWLFAFNVDAKHCPNLKERAKEFGVLDDGFVFCGNIFGDEHRHSSMRIVSIQKT